MNVLLYALIGVNLLLFMLMGVDKHKAKTGQMRIPEATLFFLAVLGGSVGGILGMLAFRHKTRHKLFSVGFPLILLLEAAGAAYLIMR